MAVAPQAPFVKPGQRQAVSLRVTDASGRPVEAEVSVAVVDKAVLALQPEFRPPLLAFFYPLERLNLMSFYSREFQSYGYGGASRLYRRTSGSPRRSLTRRTRRRTTRRTGTRASSRTRTARDRRVPASVEPDDMERLGRRVDTRGRFGEAPDPSTNAPVTISVAAPPFLRRGDRAQVRLLVANQEKKTKDVSASLAAGAGTSLEAPLAVAASLAPKQEASARGVVTLAELPASGSTALSTTLTVGGDAQRFEHPLRALPDTVSFPETKTLRAGEPFAAGAGPGESVTELRIFATSGFVAALVPSLRWLVTYPWGCAEQVASRPFRTSS